MKRIISFLAIICMLVSSIGFVGISDPPAVFCMPSDNYNENEEELFLLSDTANKGNPDTDTGKDSVSTDKDKSSDNTAGNNDKDKSSDNTTGNNSNEKSSDSSTGNNGNEKSSGSSDEESGASEDSGKTVVPEDTEDPSDEEETVETPPPVAVKLPISDDYFSQTQYSFHNTGTYLKYGNETFTEQSSTPGIDLDVARGWYAYEADEHTGQPVIIAVIDTGVDFNHPDLADSMWINPGEIPDNGKDDDGNGYIDDVYGWDFYNNDNTICHYITDEATGNRIADPDDCDDHGTHIAGVIAAARNNGIGIAGIASVGNVKIMSLKIHGGTNRKGKLSDAIKAIRYAERMGASVCNISWGTYTYSASLASAIRNSKMLFVCAAGNDGTDNDKHPIYPACFGFDNIISVGFVNAHGKLPFNSNYGHDTVDIVVPGTDIMSTTVGSYSAISGSSMAAPQVSAIAALLYSYGGRTWAGAVRDAILGSIRELDELEKLIKYPGIPSLATAIYNVGRLPYDDSPPDFSLDVGYDVNGIRISFVPIDRGGSGVNAIRYLPGARSYEDFKNGTEGLAVENNTLYLAKPGIYTFFAEDKAGNYLIKTFPIMDDIVLPYIFDASLSMDSTASQLTVSARVSDLHSGIRTVKYMRGRHSSSDFKSSANGTVLTPDENGNISFTVSEQGPYTIYVSDNRGNVTTATVMAYIRPALASGGNSDIQSTASGTLSSVSIGIIPSTMNKQPVKNNLF
ncbi:MAG: S8 family serine peptidase [Lachnospiraceae bacterium]|nr:S8 family serine peptidase [Lachnospiraceae bacterium]